MAEEHDSDAEKTEEPSTRRIEEFRRRGEVATSKELTSVLVLAGTILTLTLSMVYVYEVFSEYVEWLYRQDVKKLLTEPVIKEITDKTVLVAFKTAGPTFLASLCIGVFANVLQIGFLFAPEVLEFKPERIDPIKGTQRLFSMKSIVEAIKGIFKFLIIMVIVYSLLKDEVASYSGFLKMDFVQSFLYGKWIITKLMFSIIGGLIVVALGDFAYQKYSYMQKLRMTKEQAKRESKEHDGNPEVKQKIKSIQREMAHKRMIADIPKADVIVTNPTHISVALRYDSNTMISPQVIAKGADFLALKIREIAKEHNVPIVENVPLARGLYKTVKVNEAVPRTLYKAVAEVLAFVYKLKRKNKALS